MLIEIDISVADSAIQGNDDSIRTLQLLATSQSMGFHIIWANRSTLKKIISLSCLSDHDINIYRSILNKYVIVSSSYSKIGFRLLISTSLSTGIYPNQIVLNPLQNSCFNYVNRTRLLAENLLDTTLFNYIGGFYLRESGLENAIDLAFDSDLGGGDTTHTKYSDYANKKEILCICILDGDRKYDDVNAPFGDTYKKVKKTHNKINPFNCICYGTEKLREVENLIPNFLFLTDTNYKNKQVVKKGLSFDYSFFDLKEGLKYKSITDCNLLDYWKNNLNPYNSLIKEIETAEELMKLDLPAYKKVFEKDVFIEGFGSKLLEYILSSYPDKLELITKEMLTSSQLYEWEIIGKYIVQWCCAVTLPKNPLV